MTCHIKVWRECNVRNHMGSFRGAARSLRRCAPGVLGDIALAAALHVAAQRITGQKFGKRECGRSLRHEHFVGPLASTAARATLIAIPPIFKAHRAAIGLSLGLGGRPLFLRSGCLPLPTPALQFTADFGLACSHCPPRCRTLRSYISKGTGRQGIGSFVRNSCVRCPVVICPYLCTSEPC